MNLISRHGWTSALASPIRDVRKVTIGQRLPADAAKRVETHSLTILLAASDNSSFINLAAASWRAVKPLNSAVMPSLSSSIGVLTGTSGTASPIIALRKESSRTVTLVDLPCALRVAASRISMRDDKDRSTVSA